MKLINNYIIEKLKINKDSKNQIIKGPDEADYYDFCRWLKSEYKFTRIEFGSFHDTIKKLVHIDNFHTEFTIVNFESVNKEIYKEVEEIIPKLKTKDNPAILAANNDYINIYMMKIEYVKPYIFPIYITTKNNEILHTYLIDIIL